MGAGPTRPSSSGPAAPGGGAASSGAGHAGIRLSPRAARTAGPRRGRPRCASTSSTSFSTQPSVSRASSASGGRRAGRRARRAQSRLSATPGTFWSCRRRRFCMTRAIWPASRSLIPGTFVRRMRTSFSKRGVVDPEVEAAPAEGVRQVARAVRGQDDVRPVRGRDGPDLRDRHLEVRQDLEEEALELDRRRGRSRR